MYEWRLPCYEIALEQDPRPPRDFERFGHLEHLHYGGAPACAEWVEILEIGADDFVLDLGCGVGGTERYLFETVGCDYLGFDLRPDFVQFARRVSRRDRFRIHDIQNRWTEQPNVVLAILSLGRLDSPGMVISNMFDSFRESPRFVIEVTGPQPTIDACAEALQSAGSPLHFAERTDLWGAWTAERLRRFTQRREEFVARYGGETTRHRETFYQKVADHFREGEWFGGRFASHPIPEPRWNLDEATILEQP